MVYENAILFMREGLNMWELTTSTKRGDSRRILNICKIFALSFRGSSHLKYANEMLTLIHQATTVRPLALRSFVLLDLVQEHGNHWIKCSMSNASWSWLSVISPCVKALRAPARDLNTTLGGYMGRKHTSPNTSMDIQKIIKSLDRHANTEGDQPAENTQSQPTETEDAESVAGSDDEADKSGEDEGALIEVLKALEEGMDGSDEEWVSSDSKPEMFEDGETPLSHVPNQTRTLRLRIKEARPHVLALARTVGATFVLGTAVFIRELLVAQLFFSGALPLFPAGRVALLIIGYPVYACAVAPARTAQRLTRCSRTHRRTANFASFGMLQRLAPDVEAYARAVALARTVAGPPNAQSFSSFEPPNKRPTVIGVAIY
ncbi:hypothetical protein FRC08_008362 [Ceratobasidium sp. 394]|nr:hypothetical protein FRC08_008362 [Ceratobasidium sp. 394]